MHIGEIIKTKLGTAMILSESVYGTSAMRCLLVHHNESMHRMDEVELKSGGYVGPWGPVIILPEFIERSTGEVMTEREIIDLAWLTQIRDQGYRYEVNGPHPLPKFRSDEQMRWNPIHIPSIFSSLNQMEEE